MTICCPNCGESIPVTTVPLPQEMHCASCDARFTQATDDTAILVRDPGRETVTYVRSNAPSSAAETAIATSKRFGNYELLHEIARGGMGVVYKARQTTLNRIVALKMIKAGNLADEEEIQRFQAEAEAAAQLDHPGIVPIYEVGKQNAQHFFSMGFVEGQSLDRKLKDGPLSAKDAANLIKTIAEAVQYAHEHHIVHRDLKPANVLIGVDGKPRITDFGLAKRLSGDSGMTATGQVLGTPSYMPPEQAEGRTETIGAAADVYSLGAMLYALLTGRPPFQAANMMETLRQVCHQEPVSPRDLNASVDKDQETICLKCLEKDPAKRYASAGELAEDLTRYLARKPIFARPIGKPARMLRWCRRNPTGATVVGLLAILAFAGTGVALYQTEMNYRMAELNHQKDEALIEATEQRENAEESFKISRESDRKKGIALVEKHKALLEAEAAFDGYVKTVKNAKLLKDPRFKGLLKVLLNDALVHYQRFVDAHQDERDPVMRARLAKALYGIGIISAEKGSQDEAIRAFQQAVKIREQLVREDPTVTDHKRLLAVTHNNLGIMYNSTGKRADALTAYRQSLTIWEQVVQEEPTVAKYQSEMARAHNSLGALYAETGKPTEALAAYRTALTIWERLARENPTDTEYQNLQVLSQNNIGHVYRSTGNPSQALATFRQVLKIRQRLTFENPADTDYQSDLATSYNNLGLIYNATRRPADAMNAFRQALKIRERLARENPVVTKYQSELAGSHTNIGIVDSAIGKPVEALAKFQQALKIRKRLALEYPTVTEYQSGLATGHNNIGALYSTIGKRAEAITAYLHALTIRKQLARQNPTVIVYQTDLAAGHSNLGLLYRQAGKPADAVDHLDRAIVLLRPVLKRNPRNATARRYLHFSFMNRAASLEPLGRHADAARDWADALRLDTENNWLQLMRKQAIALARSGDHAQAVRQAEQIAAKNRAANTQCDLACVYSLSMSAAQRDAELSETERGRIAARYAAAAITHLRRAVTGRFFKSAAISRRVATDPNFAPLRQREDFRKFAKSVGITLPKRAAGSPPRRPVVAPRPRRSHMKR